MLEIKAVDTTQREGRGYIFCGSDGLNQGKFLKLNGIFTWDAGPTAYAGKPGYASSGGQRYDAATSGDDIATAVYPFKKYHYTAEDGDVTLDTTVSGQEIVVYKGGEFETDQYNALITIAKVNAASIVPGALLYLDDSSQLTTGYDTTNRVPRAMFLGLASTFNSSYAAKSMMWFRMLPQPQIPSGWAQKLVT